MKKYRSIVISLLILLCVVPSAFSEREVVDKIIAVVGDEVILASELANQLQIIALQTGQQPKNQAELEKFQKDVLDQMVSDRLFLLAAKDDTTIKVRDDEIESMLDEQVNRIAQNYDSYDDFLAALANEGLTVRELKKKYRQDVQNQLLKQRFIQKKLYSISVSRHEVEEFYKNFKDSIPDQPEAIKLAHILLTFQPSQHVLDSIRNQATELRQMVLNGADFATIASQYSTGGAGVNGGDLGYLSRNDVVPEFARAAFNLSVGDISGVIKTQFGFHIIKCEGKKDDRLKLRHILLAVQPSKDDSLRVRHLADSLVQVAQNGADFEQLAKTFSEDNDTRAEGGELGWFATAQLPPEFQSTVSGWTNVGEVRGPVQSKFGLHILKLLDYQKAKKYTLESDYDHIKELARQDKTGKFVDKLIENLKTKTYISYNEDF